MLTVADLRVLITPERIRQRVELAARLGLDHRRCRRILAQQYLPQAEGEHTIRPKDFPAFEMSVATMEAASQAVADDAEIMEAVRRFFADQSSGRPAPVLRLVPKTDPAPTPAPVPSSAGLLKRLFGSFGGSHAAEVA